MPAENPEDLSGRHASARSDTSNPRISDSYFGPKASIVQGSIFHPPAEGNQMDKFLQGISPIDSRNDKALVDGQNEGWRPEAFNELLERPVLDCLNEPVPQFLWVQDATGAGHSLLVSKLIDKVSQTMGRPNIVVAYVFCREVDNDTSIAITATQLLGALLRSLLQAISDKYPDSLVREIQKNHEQEIISSRGKDSEFHVLAKMLSLVIERVISTADNEAARRPIFIIDRLHKCSPDQYGNDASNILNWMRSAARRFKCLTWIFSGLDSAWISIERQVRKLDIDVSPVIIKPLETAEALGLMSVVEAVKDTGWRLRNIHQELQRRPRNSKPLDWFPHCTAARSWLKRTAPAPDDDSQLLWYRRSQQSPLDPSPLGVSISTNYELGDQTCTRFYFSTASVFDRGTNSSDMVAYKHLHTCQVLWYLLTLLIISGDTGRRDESAIAAMILGSPPEALQDLRDICADLRRNDNNEESKDGRPKHIDVMLQGWFNKGPPLVDWHRKTRYLDDKTLPAMERSFSEFLRLELSRNSRDFVFVVDCLEVLAAEQYTRLLDFFWNVNFNIRVLLCLDPLPQIHDQGTLNWMTRLGGTCVDEHTEYQECLQSLRFDNMYRRHDEIAEALNETNRWLKETAGYQTWEAAGGLLWISGKAGSGKSVLAKSIRKELWHIKRHEGLSCSWFYTARGSTYGMQHEYMWRTLAFQLLSSEEKAFLPARALYRGLFSPDKDGRAQWSQEALQTLLLKLSKASSTPDTLAIIDAFDDSATGPARSSTLETLTELSRLRGRIRVIVLSRVEPDIVLHFGNLPQISMQQCNAGDIDTLIRHGIGRLREAWNKRPDNPGIVSGAPSEGDSTDRANPWDVTEQQLQEAESSLKAKASGVILWVILVLKELESDMTVKYGITPAQLKEIIEGLPPELEDLYYHALEKVSKPMKEKQVNVAKEILTWIIGSRHIEPLQLLHLWEAIALPRSGDDRAYSTSVLSEHRINCGNDWSKFRNIVYQHCGALVEFIPLRTSSTSSNGKDRWTPLGRLSREWTIQLVHQTLNVFLQDADRSKHWHISPATAESRVRAASYRYLGLSEPKSLKFRYMMEVQAHESFGSIRCAFAGILEHPIELFAMKEILNERPLTSFALSVLYRHHDFENSVIEAFTGSDNACNEWDPFLANCAADLLFAPLSPGTSLRPIIRFCCSNGRYELLGRIFELANTHGSSYRSLPTQKRGLVKGRDLEIIEGAIEVLEALQYNSISYWPCFWTVASSLKRLYGRHAVNQGQVPRSGSSGSPMTEYEKNMGLLDDIIAEKSGPKHKCTELCSLRMCRTNFADGTKAWSATSGQVNSVLAKIIAWFDRRPKFSPFPLGLGRVREGSTRIMDRDDIRTGSIGSAGVRSTESISSSRITQR